MEKVQEKSKELKWLNCAKLIAIIAVLTDHSHMVLYDSQKIAVVSYFSVPLFITVSGMTSYISNSKRSDESWYKTFWRNSKGILTAYMAATFIYQIAENHYFDFEVYLNHLYRFDMASPFYYVLLYIQLMLVNRIIYHFIDNLKEKVIFKEILMFVIIIGIAYLTTNYTNILGVLGGGGVLFGGTFLIFYYMGMLLAKHDCFNIESKNIRIIMTVITGILGILWGMFIAKDLFEIDSHIAFGEVNPPSISLFIMTVLVLCFSYSLFTVLQDVKGISVVTDVCSKLGKHTLYIFLYHRLFMDYYLNRLSFNNIAVKRVVYFTVMIFAPIMVEYILKNLKKAIIDKK